jgi:pimeloyl-ACP methyl ester carboxylesterase/DNA-binding winged helix-turn-helix (wHTH) protein
MVSRITFGDFQFDPATGDLHGSSGLVQLTPKALELLGYLTANAGRLVTKRELLDALWPDVFVTDGVLKVCVREIRRALGDDARTPRFIETAHRRGYRFIAPIRQVSAATSGAPEVLGGHEGTALRTSDGGRVQYARSGDVNVAYQVLGSGPIDLVFVMGWVSHLEYFWREPSFARFLRRLASFSRLILFDKRGTGLSDPVTHVPTLEQRMDDVRAVMDAAGSKRCVLLGVSEGGPLCSLFAATYPSRTEALVMIGTYARRTRTVDYPWAPTDEEREEFCREILSGWGGPVGIDTRAPTMAHDAAFRDWWASYLRMGASPAAAVALTRMNARIDIRHVLPTVRVPTLVLHRSGDRCLHIDEGRYVASSIPDARFVELPGEDHLPFVGDADRLLDEVERFVRQPPRRSQGSRMLATILCVAARSRRSRRAAGMGDALYALVWRLSARFGGNAVERTHDRAMVVFDGPARAIRCGRAIGAAASEQGFTLTMGVHAGECDIAAGVAHGVAAGISCRIATIAEAGQVLVSRTVVDLVAGSGLQFSDRGAYRLADGLGKWHVFDAADDDRGCGEELVAAGDYHVVQP